MSHASLPRIWFIEEIKRRNVGRVAILYLVVSWLVLEPIHVIFHMLEVPIWANRLVIILLALGFAPTVVFAWVYETTPEGLKPTSEVPHSQSIRRLTGRRLDMAIISVLALALIYFVADRFWISKRVATEASTSRQSVGTVHPLDNESIAVLPFVDLTGSTDQQYFADGMAEEIINLLANIPGLKVIGRTSSFQFRNRTADVRSIGSALGAAYVLEGSLRKSNERIRVTAQLIETRDGTHRWSDTYDAKPDDVLKVQDEIAAGIARALELTVRDQAASHQIQVSPEAYDLFLKGLHALDRYSQESCQEAVADFERVLDLYPKYVPAQIGLARAYDFLGANAWVPPKVAFEQARRAALAALAIEPTNSAAHIRLASVHMAYDWNWDAADQEIAATFKYGTRDPEAFIIAGILASVRADWDKATKLAHQAIAYDPLSPLAYENLGWYVYVRRGLYAQGEKYIQRALEIDPTVGSLHFFLAITLLMENHFDAALVAANQETLDDGQLEASAAIYHALNRKADSDAFLARAIERNGDSWASAIAKVYAYRGEPDKAIEWLNRAYAQKDEDLFFISGDPLLRNLATDPRYKEFLGRMRLVVPIEKQ